MPTHLCPLCESDQNDLFLEEQHRLYFRCQMCLLVFVPSQYFLDLDEEKSRYDLHENDAEDKGYRKFLNRLCTPFNERLSAKSHGLDFGSGPGPTLSIMLEELGHSMQIYDKFYAPNEDVWSQKFDFVTATEVVEHLHQPKQELDRLWSVIKPGGYLGIMTKLVLSQESFKTWHYKNDETHVSFFSKETFEWLAAKWHIELTFLGDDVIIIEKSSVT